MLGTGRLGNRICTRSVQELGWLFLTGSENRVRKCLGAAQSPLRHSSFFPKSKNPSRIGKELHRCGVIPDTFLMSSDACDVIKKVSRKGRLDSQMILYKVLTMARVKTCTGTVQGICRSGPFLY